MEDVDAIIERWEAYFSERVKKRTDVTRIYANYVRKMLVADLPPILDFEHLSHQVGIKKRMLADFITRSEQFYRTFDLPKRRGGTRKIDVPHPVMLEAQRWIGAKILSKVLLHDAAHGFVEGRSIMSNAAPHVGSAQLLRMDLKDFFPSIGFRRGLLVFLRLGYPTNVSYYLARLCFKGDVLPQGAATSPQLSNIIAKRFDARVSGAAAKRGILYSRYADDLTFSGAEVELDVVSIVSGIAIAEGFKINPAKTQFLTDRNKKIVTGISVGGPVLRVPRAYSRRLRQDVHFVLKYGYWEEAERKERFDPLWLERLLGRLNFWLQVEPENATAQKLQSALQAYASNAT